MSVMNPFSPNELFDLSTFKHASIFQGCESAWEVLKRIKPYLEQIELGEIECDVPYGAFLTSRELISIGKGTVIEPGAYIQGPCIIGENCTIRHGAYIRGQVITGDNCVIGHTSEIKNSLFLNGAQAAHFAYVGDSVLGNRVNLGAGTKFANLKFDHSLVVVRFEGKAFETHLKKMGAILGDDAQTGCNAVTNPGTIFGKGAACYPCSNPRGFIPPRQIAK